MNTKEKLLTCNRLLLLVTWLSLMLLIFLSPVDAATLDVTPNEGTIGTTFTISGSGFETIKG